VLPLPRTRGDWPADGSRPVTRSPAPGHRYWRLASLIRMRTRDCSGWSPCPGGPGQGRARSRRDCAHAGDGLGDPPRDL